MQNGLVQVKRKPCRKKGTKDEVHSITGRESPEGE